LKSGFKACVELTVYPDGHAGIAVSEIQGTPPARRIVQRDSLPLNGIDELRSHTLAVIDQIAMRAGAKAPPAAANRRSSTTQHLWSVSELEHELSRFEQELVRAELRRTSIDTYVGRSSIFLRWLRGDYKPRGPAGG